MTACNESRPPRADSAGGAELQESEPLDFASVEDMQLEIEVLDHAEAADVELAEHGAILDRSADVPGEVELLAYQRVERRRVVPSRQSLRRRNRQRTRSRHTTRLVRRKSWLVQ